MRRFCFLMFLVFPFFVFPQEINPVHYEKTWLDNQKRTIYGHNITKVFGQLPHTPSAYNFMPLTSVAFRSHLQLLRDLNNQANAENWSSEKLEEETRRLVLNAKGGEIEIYISRNQEAYANFRWFFVIIRGADDKGKLWEKEIGYQAPQNPYERGWWNYTTLRIPVPLTTPFYIYLNDKSSRYLSDFKFKVENTNE